MPTPAAPWITLPNSAYTGTWFSVNAGGSTCPGGTNTYYQFSDSWGGNLPADGAIAGIGNYNGSDIWNTHTGRVFYTVAIACQGPSATGAFSAPATDWIDISAPPVPDAPSGVSGIYLRGGSGGGSVSISFGTVPGATSYEYGGILFTSTGSSGWSSLGATSGGTYGAKNICGTPRAVISAQVRVRAINSSGSSGYSTVAATVSAGQSCV